MTGPLQYKTVALVEAKAHGGTAGAGGEITGYGAVFGNVDMGGDRIIRGAFKDDLPRFLEAGVVAWQHDAGTPIAIPVEAREDERGLWFRATFHSTPPAQDARRIVMERLAAGKSFGLSIGYGVPEGGARMAEYGVRELTRIKLYEISLVSVPMNPLATIGVAKEDPAARSGLQEFLVASYDQLQRLGRRPAGGRMSQADLAAAHSSLIRIA